MALKKDASQPSQGDEVQIGHSMEDLSRPGLDPYTHYLRFGPFFRQEDLEADTWTHWLAFLLNIQSQLWGSPIQTKPNHGAVRTKVTYPECLAQCVLSHLWPWLLCLPAPSSKNLHLGTLLPFHELLLWFRSGRQEWSQQSRAESVVSQRYIVRAQPGSGIA